jgi:hypothetical protein
VRCLSPAWMQLANSGQRTGILIPKRLFSRLPGAQLDLMFVVTGHAAIKRNIRKRRVTQLYMTVVSGKDTTNNQLTFQRDGQDAKAIRVLRVFAVSENPMVELGSVFVL